MPFLDILPHWVVYEILSLLKVDSLLRISEVISFLSFISLFSFLIIFLYLFFKNRSTNTLLSWLIMLNYGQNLQNPSLPPLHLLPLFHPKKTTRQFTKKQARPNSRPRIFQKLDVLLVGNNK